LFLQANKYLMQAKKESTSRNQQYLRFVASFLQSGFISQLGDKRINDSPKIMSGYLMI